MMTYVSFFFTILNSIKSIKKMFEKDLHGAWETFVGHHTALYPRQDESPEQKTLNVDWACMTSLHYFFFSINFLLYNKIYIFLSELLDFTRRQTRAN